MLRYIFVLVFSLNFAFGLDKSNSLNSSLADAPVEQIKAKLHQVFPNLVLESIESSPVANLYEISANRKIFYVDSQVKYAILGDMIDLSSKINLTSQRRLDLNRVKWQDLPLNLALKVVNGDGSRHIAVFSDPDCPFCKLLEANTLSKLTNITIYYFIYPLAIHDKAKLYSERILCSTSPIQAYISWMRHGEWLNKTNVTCPNIKKLDSIKKLANTIVGVQATPTIVLGDGSIVVGNAPLKYLNHLINTTSK